jgi:hypothetical protein
MCGLSTFVGDLVSLRSSASLRRLAKGGGPMRNRVERGVSFHLPNRFSFGRRAPRITHAG